MLVHKIGGHFIRRKFFEAEAELPAMGVYCITTEQLNMVITPMHIFSSLLTNMFYIAYECAGVV